MVRSMIEQISCLTEKFLAVYSKSFTYKCVDEGICNRFDPVKPSDSLVRLYSYPVFSSKSIAKQSESVRNFKKYEQGNK